MNSITYKFVEFMPKNEDIEEGILYISMEYATATHKCVCGCGNLVVTPISPTDWELSFNGKSVSLYPSIGNWNFDCKSHYFITRNKIRFARIWDDDEIEEGRERDRKLKENYYNQKSKNKDES